MRSLGPALVLASLLTACVGTAVPQPPNLAPVDPERVAGTIPEMEGGRLLLTGAPGAAAADAELYVWDLGAATPPSVIAIAGDGSFSASLPAPRGALRLQARAADSRSEPVDVAPRPDASLPVARPECLAMQRELFLTDARVADLAIRNDCDGEVTLGATRLRAGDAFEVERPTALTLPSRTLAELVVSAPGDAAEEILLVELTLDATTYLYAVTVSAPPR